MVYNDYIKQELNWTEKNFIAFDLNLLRDYYDNNKYKLSRCQKTELKQLFNKLLTQYKEL